MLLWASAQTSRLVARTANRRRNASAITAIQRQEKSMSSILRKEWKEEDVIVLPAGEQDYFDRKSGALLNDPDFRKDVAKALSAFANSGGGHLLLGVRNDGSFDGVPEIHKGRTRTREWLEQTIPLLLNHALDDFRVHEVIPGSPSLVPTDRIIIAIDVGDSPLAPHQSAVDKLYYYRVGSHSMPAPHFYLETLRNRLSNPILKVDLVEVAPLRAYDHDDGIFVELRLKFRIHNTGRIAAYKWALAIRELRNLSVNRTKDYVLDHEQFPQRPLGERGTRLDSTLLPGFYMEEGGARLGITLRPASLGEADILADLAVLVANHPQLCYRVATETSLGENIETNLASFLATPVMAAKILPVLTSARTAGALRKA
jgi:Putative DNA-binding domain